MAKRRTGLPNLAYMGVEASTPPQFVYHDRAPTANDYANFNIGTIWLHETVAPIVEEIWILVNKDNKIATWLEFAVGAVGVITRVDGGLNINTINPAGPHVIVNLDLSIHQPLTTADGTEGVYFLGAVGGVGGNTFLHGIGTQNTFVGQSAGNLGLNAANARRNTGVGYQALRDNIDGENNTAIGESSLSTIVGGDRNVAIGHGCLDEASDVDFNTSVGGDSLSQLDTGDYNTVLGYRGGFNYTTNESDNILIGNEGVIADDNTIRIGTEGNGAGQQDATFIAGIYTNAPGVTTRVAFVDDDGKMGSSTGNSGEVLIGSTGGAAAWTQLTAGAGIAIAAAPNAITITNTGGGGGGGAATFVTDVNSPATIGGTTSIDIFGGGIIQTDGGGGSNTVTVSLTDGTSGQLLIGGNGAGPAWANLTSVGGSITVTPGVNTLNIEAVGGGGGANTFVTDAGNAVSVAGVIDVLGGLNINTAGAGAVVTVHLDTSIILPDTNAAGTQGLYKLASGTTFMHNFGAAGTSYNTFLGEDAGNLTHTTSVDCTGIGYEALNSLTTGDGNTSVGSGSGKDVTTGSNNTSLGIDSLFQVNAGDLNTTIGYHCFNGIVTGDFNIGLGESAGSNCTAADSDNIMIGNDGVAGDGNRIRIGTQGGGAGQQNSAFMAGIHGITPAGAYESVIIDANGELGSAPGGAGTITQILGGDNINVLNGLGPVTTVNLDTSIFQPTTNASGLSGQYALGGASFLHNYTGAGALTTKNVFLGNYAGNYTNTGIRNIGIGTGDPGGADRPPLLNLTNGYDNVAIGTDALGRLSTGFQNIAIGKTALEAMTTGNSNVAIGKDAGKNLTTGDLNTFVGERSGGIIGANDLFNTAIGDNSGNISGDANTSIGSSAFGYGVGSSGNYNVNIGRSSGNAMGAGDSNIYISSNGVLNDDNTIRIGTQGTGNGQQDITYIAGIYNRTLSGSTARPTYIDNDGQLGTLGGDQAAFLYRQVGNVAGVTGDGSVYQVGEGYVMTQVFDQGANVYPGNGTGNPAYFEAPFDGLYFLEVSFLITGLIAPPPPATPVNSDPNIITPARTYSLVNSVYNYQTSGNQSYFFNAICNMSAGHKAYFTVDIDFNGTRDLGVGGSTFICGNLVSLT